MTKTRHTTRRTPPKVIRTIPELSDDAIVMRDALLEGRNDEITRVAVANLMRHALNLHRRQYPRRHPERRTHWTNRLGMRTTFEVRGEHSYICVFCQDNVITLGNRGGSLPAVLVRRLELHGWTCGMLYLMERGGHPV